jgi:nitrogen-specific signal transduction histidine kinase
MLDSACGSFSFSSLFVSIKNLVVLGIGGILNIHETARSEEKGSNGAHGKKMHKTDCPVWVWDPDRSKIVWANQTGLKFWNEETLLDLSEKDFPPKGSMAAVLGKHLAIVKRDGVSHARLVLSPSGQSIRVDCVFCKYQFPDERIGLNIEIRHSASGVDADAEVDRFREIVERSPVATALFSEDGVLLYQNFASELTFGSGQQASLVKSYGDREIARSALKSVLVNGTFSHAHDLETLHGRKRHRISFRRMHDPVTCSLAALAFMSDISDRYTDCSAGVEYINGKSGDEQYSSIGLHDKTLPPQLDEVRPFSERVINKTSKIGRDDIFAKYREQHNILEDLDVGVVVFQDDLVVNFFNTAITRYFDLSQNEGHGFSITNLFPYEAQHIKEAVERLKTNAGTENIKLDLPIREDSGKIRWFVGNVRKTQWKKKSSYLVLLVDVTGERRALVDMKVSERAKTQALAKLDSCLLVLDSEVRVVDAPYGVCKNILDVHESALKNTSFVDLLSMHSKPLLIKYLAAVQDSIDTIDSLEDRKLCLDMSNGRRVELSATMISHSRESCWCFALKSVDLDDGRSFEKIKEDDSTGDTSANTSVDPEKLIAHVSHELRTPLNAILGFAELMKDNEHAVNGSKYHGYIADIYDCGQHMMQLLDNMLLLRQISSGVCDLVKIPADLGSLTEFIARMFVPLAKKRDVTLSVNIAPGLPRVNIDEDTIRQSVINIVSNSVKYVSERGIVYISVSVEEPYGVVLEVGDNGIGMTEEELQIAKQVFGRPVDRPSQEKGTGLGLPLAQRMAEMNDVRFSVESEKGVGTIVRYVFGYNMIVND